VSALIAHDLVRKLGGRRILDVISLTASPGRRIGLIGANGVGKSSLLRALAGVDEPDAGSVTRPADLGFPHQEMPYDAESTIATVLDEALREAREGLAQLDRRGEELARTPESENLLDAYGRRLEQAQHRDSWDADRRAALVLDAWASARSTSPPFISPPRCVTSWRPRWARAPAQSSWPVMIAGRRGSTGWNGNTACARSESPVKMVT
jgi:ATPase subunit of ABC transporter with duplicated ATPase domains